MPCNLLCCYCYVIATNTPNQWNFGRGDIVCFIAWKFMLWPLLLTPCRFTLYNYLDLHIRLTTRTAKLASIHLATTIQGEICAAWGQGGRRPLMQYLKIMYCNITNYLSQYHKIDLRTQKRRLCTTTLQNECFNISSGNPNN